MMKIGEKLKKSKIQKLIQKMLNLIDKVQNLTKKRI